MLFRLSFLYLLFLTAFGCKKAPERTCFKKTGKSLIETTHFEEINVVNVYDDVNIILIQDSLSYIETASYENIINHISIQFENHELVIKNNNKCRFLRDYDKQTTVKIHTPNLKKLAIYGKGKIETQNTIISADLHLYAHSSNSEIDLAVNSTNLTVEFVNGTVSGKIKGIGQESYLFHSGYSNVNFIDLETKNLRVINKSYSSTFVNVTNSLSSKIENTGNIYYKGNPTIENSITLSSGKLLKYTE